MADWDVSCTAFVQANPPESVQTDISLSQFLAIQEKGVSAWEFEPELEIANCFVEARTEIEFFDSECSVQSNLPIPKQNEVYYWEAKLYDKPETTTVSIGLTTKPYPLFRLPGLHKYSVAYLSTGQRRYNQPFTATNYGPPYVQGDIIGVGYRPRTGAIFFTRNGKKFEEVAHGLKTQNFFPTVGANGPCNVHVNFGQMGFVFLEAQVKKWGLAPMTGSLAPPPPYGSEAGSILLEGGREGVREGQGGWYPGHGRTSSNQLRLGGRPMRSPNGPERSPTDISLAQLNLLDYTEATSGAGSGMGSGDDHHNLVSPTTTADDDAGEGSAAAFSPPPRNSSYKPQQHHRQYSSSQQHHYQSLPPPQMHLDPGLPLEPADHPPPEYESPEDEERREFLMSGGRGYEQRGSSRSGSSSGSGSGEEDDSPTPRAGQQQQQSRNPNLGRRRRDQSAQYQQQRQHHQQGRQRQHRPDSPPIPSYEAAVDDARRQGLS